MKWLVFLLCAIGCHAGVNRIPNSSFEVGSGRGWAYYAGNANLGNSGSLESFRTNSSFHGGYSMKVPSGYRLMSRAMWLTNGSYAMTAYIRGTSAAGPCFFGMQDWESVEANLTPPSSIVISTSWVRYTNSFTATSNALYYVKFYHTQNIDMLVDAVQVEAGTVATPWVPQNDVEVGLSIANTNNLWFSGDSPTFRLNFWNEAAAVTSRVAYAVYDMWNSNVLSGTISASLAALTNGSTDVSLPARKGWFRITSRITSIDDSGDEVTTVVYPFASNVVSNVETDWLGGHPGTTPFHARRELLTGRKFARILSPAVNGTRWQLVEPTRGNFVWTDYIFTNLHAEGITIIAPLTTADGTWNTWATNADGSADIMAWSNYCYQVVLRYKNYCTYWEVGPNEPEQSGPTTPINVQDAAGTNYATLLSYGVAAITNADPNAKIIGMAGTYGDGSWAMRVWTNLTLATQTNIDIISTHIYPQDQGTDPNLAADPDARTSNAKGWIQRWGGLRPVWNTESGANSLGPIKGINGFWPEVFRLYGTFTHEAERAERMNRQLFSASIILPEALRDIGYGFEKYFYYDTRYWNSDIFSGTRPYAADYLGVDRPEIAALSIATHFVRKGFGKITNVIGKHLEMYSYTNAVGQAVVAAWNSDRTNRTATLSSSAYALYDCMGNLIQTNVAAARIHRIPQYFVSGSHSAVALSNILATASVVQSADVFPPQISVDIAPSGTWTEGDALFKWCALDDTWHAYTTADTSTNVLYQWKLNNDAYSEYSQASFAWATNLTAGNHTLWVRAKDRDQNTSEISYVFDPQTAVGGSGNSATSATINSVIVVPPPP